MPDGDRIDPAMIALPRAKAARRAVASERVRAEWLRRVEAEYRSAAITQNFTLWLMQLGASPDLIRLGLRIVADEMAHAALSHRAFEAAGGEGAPRIVRESLALTRHESEALEIDVARVCVDVFCLGETVAVPLFKELREGCTVPVARRVLDRVLLDEVRHRDFGWTLLTALLELPMASSVRALVTRELPTYFARLQRAYAPSALPVDIDDEDRAWGLMATARYASILARTLERDWVPRFGRLGFDAATSWLMASSVARRPPFG
jgi:hypothetical protein